VGIVWSTLSRPPTHPTGFDELNHPAGRACRDYQPTAQPVSTSSTTRRSAQPVSTSSTARRPAQPVSTSSIT